MRRSEGRPKYGLWMEQGLGKTASALNEFVDNGCAINIVVCPNSFQGSWLAAPVEWGVPDVFTAQFSKTDNASILKRGDQQLYTLSYEAIRFPSTRERITELMTAAPVMFTIDESSAIKNPQAKQTKAVIEIAREANRVRELNGTPLTKNVLDYYGQLKALGALSGKNQYAFRNRYAKMGGFMGKQVTGIDPDHEEELYAILDQYTFRALKQDWRDLPPQIDQVVALEMTQRQRKHYERMMEEFYTVVNGVEFSASMVLTQMDKLRQISSCVLIEGDRHEWIEKPDNNPKVRAVEDIIDSGAGKVILVYFYKQSGQVLLDWVTQAGLEPAVLGGGMKFSDIEEQKRRFNDDPSCRVMIAQEAAACMGHTLLGGEGSDRCTRMIFYENSFSLRDRLQMRDRNHRGDQDQPCNYYDLSTSSMDMKVINNLIAKKTMADTIDEVVKAVRGRKT